MILETLVAVGVFAVLEIRRATSPLARGRQAELPRAQVHGGELARSAFPTYPNLSPAQRCSRCLRYTLEDVPVKWWPLAASNIDWCPSYNQGIPCDKLKPDSPTTT